MRSIHSRLLLTPAGLAAGLLTGLASLGAVWSPSALASGSGIITPTAPIPSAPATAPPPTAPPRSAARQQCSRPTPRLLRHLLRKRLRQPPRQLL